MSKKKKSSGITLKELIERGVVDKYYHLQEQRYVGGLSVPPKGFTEWWKNLDELSTK